MEAPLPRTTGPAVLIGTAALPLALLAGCTSTDAGDRSPPAANPSSAADAIRKVDEVVLRETDSVYVGRPIGTVIGPDGTLYVSDDVEDRVVSFTRTGELSRTYGRLGHGPGELTAPSRLGMVGDSVLLVADGGRAQVTAYDVTSGAYLYDVRIVLGTGGGMGAIRTRHDTVWMGARDLRRQTGVVTWSATDPTARPIVAFPPIYRTSRAVAITYSYILAPPLGDSLLVSYYASPELLLTDLQGHVRRTLRIPTVRRRAIAPDLDRRYREARTADERARLVPLLAEAHQLSSGTIALVSYDIDWPGQVPLRRAWVILLAPDLQRGCLDLPLPLSRDGMGQVAFHGDTLVTLEQEVHELGVRLVSRRYVVDEDACPWQPLAPPS
ncbi:MAG TPA: hypothetical protein VFS08_03390 [Gemmatimonadaceae bacterium]|nr:hypothetical protein [Gemmatimonadaceae bacterium]